jgi:hypothetical protein
MSTVGIIANPASGKDLRRIIASGMTVTNQVKENMVQRMLLAMDCLGVKQALLMPDRSNLARRVLRELEGELQQLAVRELALPYVLGTQDDSTLAAGTMAEMGVDVIIVLGGDGTSRVVSKSSGDVPILPVSTGTNNVFPRMLEGTLVGMAAAALATGVVSADEVCRRAPRLELVDHEDRCIDHALVDLAIIDAVDTAARAVWEPQRIRELYLTQARVDCIGMAAIGAQVEPLPPFSGSACRLVLGEQGRRITAPIAPGLMADLYVSDCQQFDETACLSVALLRGVVALDGEREHVLSEDLQYRVRYNPMGPRVLDVDSCLQLASARGYLRASE